MLTNDLYKYLCRVGIFDVGLRTVRDVSLEHLFNSRDQENFRMWIRH